MSATVLRKKSAVFEEAVKWTMDAVEEMKMVDIVNHPVESHFSQSCRVGRWAWCPFCWCSAVIVASRVVAVSTIV